MNQLVDCNFELSDRVIIGGVEGYIMDLIQSSPRIVYKRMDAHTDRASKLQYTKVNGISDAFGITQYICSIDQNTLRLNFPVWLFSVYLASCRDRDVHSF